MNHRFYFILILLLVAFGVLFLLSDKNVEIPKETETIVVFKNITVMAETADTKELRIRGLSGHAPLSEGSGMWFDFKTPGLYGIWMKQMNFPLDILWFDEAFRIVYVKENAEPASFPEVFTPLSPAQYVLEVPAGFVKKYHVSLGDTASVQKNIDNH